MAKVSPYSFSISEMIKKNVFELSKEIESHFVSFGPFVSSVLLFFILLFHYFSLLCVLRGFSSSLPKNFD